MAGEFAAGAKQAFIAADNLGALTSVIYHVAPTGGSSSYDPATGTATVTATQINVDVFFARFRQFEIDGVDIRSTDCKILIEAARLGATVRPKLSDWIEETDGRRWQIKNDLSPPSLDVLWILHARAAA